jgi:hypothetical protein
MCQIHPHQREAMRIILSVLRRFLRVSGGVEQGQQTVFAVQRHQVVAADAAWPMKISGGTVCAR